MARAASRVRQTSGSAVLVGVLVATVLAGCGGSSAPDAGEDEPATVISQRSNPSAPPAAADGTAELPQPPGTGENDDFTDPFNGVEQEPFTGPTAEEFGAENVADAYRTVALFNRNVGYIDTLMRRPTGATQDPREFLPLQPYLTPYAQNFIDETLPKAFAGNEDAKGTVSLLTLFDLESDETKLAPPPVVLGPRYGPATIGSKNVSVDGRNQRMLTMSMDIAIDLRLLYNGEPGTLTYTRKMTYTLAPNPGNPDIPWRINGWTGTQTQVVQ